MSLQRSGLLPDTQRVNPVSEIHREAQEGNFPDRQTDRHLRPLPPLSTDVCLGVVRAFTGAPVCGEREPKARGETRLGRPGAAVGEGTGWVGLQVSGHLSCCLGHAVPATLLCVQQASQRLWSVALQSVL